MIGGPGDAGGDLDEVKVTATARTADQIAKSSVKTPPQEILPEIVVQAQRIPWWVWGLVGALGVMMLMNRRSAR